MLRQSVLGLLLIATAVAPAAAQPSQQKTAVPTELYRYTDKNGRVVLDRLGVPPEYVSQGYEVLNDKGRVIRVVPPAPSLEERQRQAEEKAKASSDAQLLRIYSEPADVDRALERKLALLVLDDASDRRGGSKLALDRV